MGNNGIYIVKRDGKRVPFSIQKIENAIAKAFLSVGAYATQDDLTPILARLHISDGMTVEEIQNQVEVALMAEKYSRWPNPTCSTGKSMLKPGRSGTK